jgi:ketopantoate hydroxymethyltransferase
MKKKTILDLVEMKRTIGQYAADVRDGTFPGPEHVYGLLPGEAEKLDLD